MWLAYIAVMLVQGDVRQGNAFPQKIKFGDTVRGHI